MTNEEKAKILDFLVEHKLIKYDSWSYCGIQEGLVIFPEGHMSIEDEGLRNLFEKLFKKAV